MPSYFCYILHLPITPCSYINLLFLCILHLSLMMRQSRPWVSMRRATLIKSAVSSSPHDSQETARLNEDIERSSVTEDRTSPTTPSQVLALTLQCDMWLHVAYGVYLVMLLIRVNYIYLVNTLYLWIWHAFLFLGHTTSAYHTMFLHQTTVLVYPASIGYDETVTPMG